MKTNWFVKSLGLGLGLGLAVALLALLQVSSTAARPPVEETPPVGSSAALDPVPPYLNPDGSVAIPPAMGRVAAEQPNNVSLGWTVPYSDPVRSIAWGDYDNDGDLDLLVGNGPGTDSRLYRNNDGALTFLSALNCSSSIENASSVNWYDYDRDGYLDITMGVESGQSCILHNNEGDGTFRKDWQTDVTSSHPTRSAAWAGWWDTGSQAFKVVLALGNNGKKSAVYFRDAGDMSPQTFAQSYNTNSIAWGDYDHDGDPDLALGNFDQPSVIFENEQGIFTPTIVLTMSLLTQDVAWGDMNGDGYLDLALGNGENSGTIDKDYVFCNSGSEPFQFTPCWTSSDNSATMAVAWGDYDGDGDLDLAAVSEINKGGTRIYFNTNGKLASDAEKTLGDTSKPGRDVAWADSDGDGDLELTVAYASLPGMPAYITNYINDSGNWHLTDFEANTTNSRALAWGDYNGDGLQDLAVGNSGATLNRVYTSDGTQLTLTWTAPAGYNTRSVAWGDFDNDGDLDLAVGNGQDGDGQANIVYRNTGGNLVAWGGFHDNTPYNTTAIAWGDMNGDGTLDLVEGNYENDQTNRIFINRGGVFTQTRSFGAATDQTLSLAVGDFDQDYDLDVVVGNYLGVDRVYINNGNATFTTLDLDAPTGQCVTNNTRSVAWADWDGDGDLDIAEGMDGCVRVLEAVKGSTWSFTEAWKYEEYQFNVNSVAWGDYDGDGRPDLALGMAGEFTKQNFIYRNVGGSMERAWIATLAGYDRTKAVAWGDLDNDGDLDLAVANDATADRPDRLYINTWLNSTHLPDDPIEVRLLRPDSGVEDDAAFFSSAAILVRSVIPIEYYLKDNQSDRAFRVQLQVSWDGGYAWEPAWGILGDQSGMIYDRSATPAGVHHIFQWDALHQLLAHQGILYDPSNSVFVPFGQSIEEMDVAFRVVAWSNPEHGGPILRPVRGAYSNMARLDMRPDWSKSAKTAETDNQICFLNGVMSNCTLYIHPGEMVSYTLEVTQTDRGMPSFPYNPRANLEDHLPTGLTYEYLSDPNFGAVVSSTTKNFIWEGEIPYQGVLHFDYTARATLPLTNNLELVNCANIYDGVHEPFDRCVSIVISSTAYITESNKLVNGVTENLVYPGDPLTYTIVLTDTGDDNFRDALLLDPISPHLAWQGIFSTTSGVLTYTNGVLQWMGDINVFEPVFITYVVNVKDPLPGNTVITNSFTLSNDLGVFSFGPVTTTVLAPDLTTSLKSAAPARVDLGDPITYTVVLTNTGALDALAAVFEDPIPGGSQYVPGTLKYSEGQGGYDDATQVITWTGNITVGHVITLSFQTEAGLPQGVTNPTITNTATITDPIGGLFNLVATTAVRLPNLGSSYKSAQISEVELGDVLTYTILIRNTGGYGPDLDLTDPVPEGINYVPGSVSSSDGKAKYNNGSDTITWSNALDGGQSATVQFAVIADCPVLEDTPVFTDTTVIVITNTASLLNSVGALTTLQEVTPIRMPNFSTSAIKPISGTIAVGDLMQYTIELRNTGGNAPEAWMLDVLPIEMEWSNTYTITSGVLTYDATYHRIRWDGALQPGTKVTITFVMRVKEDAILGLVYNTADLHYGCGAVEIIGPSVIEIVEAPPPPSIYYVFLPVVMR